MLEKLRKIIALSFIVLSLINSVALTQSHAGRLKAVGLGMRSAGKSKVGTAVVTLGAGVVGVTLGLTIGLIFEGVQDFGKAAVISLREGRTPGLFESGALDLVGSDDRSARKRGAMAKGLSFGYFIGNLIISIPAHYAGAFIPRLAVVGAAGVTAAVVAAPVGAIVAAGATAYSTYNYLLTTEKIQSLDPSKSEIRLTLEAAPGKIAAGTASLAAGVAATPLGAVVVGGATGATVLSSTYNSYFNYQNCKNSAPDRTGVIGPAKNVVDVLPGIQLFLSKSQ